MKCTDQSRFSGGFTLIELLVVISVVSMLSSIVLVSVSPAQAKGRDAKRIQQVRQLDLATRLYIENNGHAPYLTGCEALQTTDASLINDNTTGQVSGCFAVSTAAVGPQKDQWDEFVDEIKDFIPSVPDDPCPSCTAASSYPIGYTYVAPRAAQFVCTQSGDCPGYGELARYYQMYAGLEKNATPSGYSSTGSFNSVVVPSASITITSPTGGSWAFSDDMTISWNSSGIPGGTEFVIYQVNDIVGHFNYGGYREIGRTTSSPFIWSVGPSGPFGTGQFKIRISATGVTVDSAPFNVTSP